ncbi:MAG: multicopper oxidase domain-containing protein [Deltaproteobacteria bacterium]|nr:multicopper oxidase domain-containing protein [Deltaproteobacteria bacterium]
MNCRSLLRILPLLAAVGVLGTEPSRAVVAVQCPGDANGDAIPDGPVPPGVKCMHVGAGDGFVTMADGHLQYIFSFMDLTGVADEPATPPDERVLAGLLAADYSAPTIVADEGDELYLSLTNVGMMMRPDLFDPHSIHWHGFPQAAAVFDGVPESSMVINMGSTFTYYYNVAEPGTYLWHCHVEATEHMQMGMLGNLYVRPAQDKLPAGTVLAGGFVHQPGYRYAYNDGDGSTRYDVDFPVQLSSFDSNFHDLHLAVQPLPFAAMRDDYAMINGRGYPDTVNPAPLPPPADETGALMNATDSHPTGYPSQKLSSLVTAAAGQRVLLRVSNVSIQRFFTLQSLGVPLKVVGWNARLLRGADPDGPGPLLGKDLYYTTSSVTLGGGESADVLLQVPAGAAPGTTYFLYTSNLNYLNNGENDATLGGQEALGGMLTEIRVL